VDNNIVNELEINNNPVSNNILDKKVENPSNHAQEEKVVTEDTTVIATKSLDDNLGAYEKKVVETYRNILNKDGEEFADNWFSTQAKYLPRGFNPKNF
jgi:hypothetical protein